MSASAKFRLPVSAKPDYLSLVLEFPLASIRSDAHLRAAQEVLDRLLARGKLSRGQLLYVDALSDLVSAYEDEHHALEPPTDADLLGHLLAARGVSQAELHRATGIPRSSISEVLAGKKPFSRQMIRKLATYFRVDQGLFTARF